MNYCGSLCAVAILLGILAGCGDDGKESDVESPEVQYASSVRDTILNELLKSGEVPLKARVNYFLENMEGYEAEEFGEHQETFNQIVATAKELQELVNSNGSRSEIDKKLEELKSLAMKLPEGSYKAEPAGGETEDE